MTALLLGALAGAGYGYVAQRGAFCLNSGFRNAFASGDSTKVKALALAVALQMIVLPPLLLTGVVAPTIPPLFPVGAVVGGLLFGASMRWAVGCAAGVVFKTGGRSSGAFVAMLGMVAGASAMEIGPLRPVRDLVRGAEVPTRAALGLDLAGAGGGLLVLLGIVIIALVWRTRVTRAGDWSWRRTGTLLGLVGAAAWGLSGLAGRDFGLAVIPGAVGAVAGLVHGAAAVPVFDLALVVGIVLGAAIAVAGTGARPSALAPRDAIKRLLGGIGLGVGASVAAGCTVGHGLAGLPLLAPGSILTMLAIFAGANLIPIYRRAGWRACARRHSRESPECNSSHMVRSSCSGSWRRAISLSKIIVGRLVAS